MKKLLFVLLISCASIAMAQTDYQTDYTVKFVVQAVASSDQSADKLQGIINDFENQLKQVADENGDIVVYVKRED